MASRRKTTVIDRVSLAEGMKLGVERTIETRVTGLEGLERVRRAKQPGLAREAARLAARRAGAERLAAVEEKATLNRTLCGQLELEAARTKTEPPARSPDAWTLHGRVYTDDLAPAPNHAVTVHDRKGERVEGVPRGPTDAEGYFKLKFAPRKGSKSARALADAGPRQRADAYFLHVSNRRGETVHVDDRPLWIVRERVVYKEIQLSAKSPAPRPGKGAGRKKAGRKKKAGRGRG